MWFQVDPRSSVPIYQQLIDSVKEGMAKGLLQSGDKLPSVRELAAQVAINHNTIAKAYQELEREGVIETLRGKGTFVAAQAQVEDWRKEERKQMIKGMLEKICVEAFHLQIEEDELIELLEETVKTWYRDRGEQR